ncbi:MAG: DUF2156 domain-containing protein [Myxococcales bacterium]|nr:DUF2156 domain-containing protein [Myxococcales bacterium]
MEQGEPESTPDDEHARVLDLLRRFGRNATSFQLLERGFCYWFVDPDACVAYVDTGSAWVGAGDPVAAEARAAEIASLFFARARRAGKRACFFASESPALHADPGLKHLLVGEQPVWDPSCWNDVLAAHPSLRYQLRRATRKGVSVRAVDPSELDAGSPLRLAIERLITLWLSSRSMAPMGFLVDVQPFEHRAERRYFVAERDGRTLGFLAAVPAYGRAGWFFEDLLRKPASPNGTAELLIDFAMRSVGGEGAQFVTLGLAPLRGPVEPWMQRTRSAARPLYDFSGVAAFKAKLHPARWEPVYLVVERRSSLLIGLLESFRAFAHGSLLRFGLRTLLRGPTPVLWALGLALVPWTLGLGLMDARWFPAPWVRDAWLAFDCLLALGLVLLARRYRHSLAKVLALVITADAVVTAIEVLSYNVERLQRPTDALLLFVACLAPTLAACVLWGTLSRRAV